MRVWAKEGGKERSPLLIPLLFAFLALSLIGPTAGLAEFGSPWVYIVSLLWLGTFFVRPRRGSRRASNGGGY